MLAAVQQAGIAQLVEQATENRRVPSSNLGPGILVLRILVSHQFRAVDLR